MTQLLELLRDSVPHAREVSASTALVSDLGLESIQVIEFLCEVEDHFDVVIDEDSLSDVQTVADLAQVVARIRGG